MPFQYFTGSPLKFVPDKSNRKFQSDNPFASNYIAPHGKDYYPPIFYKIRPKIIEKYNGKCFLCGEECNDVHHIDYNKMNCEEWNLVPLCKYCHAYTNSNRSYWENLIKEKLGQDKEI